MMVGTSSMVVNGIYIVFVVSLRATQDVAWHRGVFDFLDLTRMLPAVIHSDNMN